MIAVAKSMPQSKGQKQAWHNRLVSLSRYITYRSPIYTALLNGQVPTHLQQTPRDAFAGDGNIGQQIMRGTFPLGGKEYPMTVVDGSMPLWQWNLPPDIMGDLHGFRWLRHLHAVGGNAARQTARALIADWMSQHRQWSETIWSPASIGERLTGWLSQYAFFGSSADDAFRHDFFQSLMRQLRHLVRRYDTDSFGASRISAIKGMLYAAFALGEEYLDLNSVIQELQESLHLQILADGCYYARSPGLQAKILADLIEIRSLYTYAQLPIPAGIAESITAMARALRSLRHGDGGLAVFHGSYEDNPEFLDLLLVSANVKGKSADQLEDSGWHRLNVGRSLVLIDAGTCACEKTAKHISPLAFEFSIGRERVIVNCGSGACLDAGWAEACRQEAAHSGLEISGYHPKSPFTITSERKCTDGNWWFSGSHNGYSEYGITHSRNIFLNSTGDDIRGEDIVSRSEQMGFSPLPIRLRFHLHPKVQSIEAQNSVLLRLPSGAGWRLRTSGGKVELADSVYLGQKGTIQKTKQIILSGELLGEQCHIKWAIQKESKK